MVRFWRSEPGRLLAAYVILDVLLIVYTRTAGASLNAGTSGSAQLAWTALDGFLVWRVWRGGRVSWVILVAINGLAVAALVMGVASPWGLYQLGLLVFIVVQLAVLLSPAVRAYRPGSRSGTATGHRSGTLST